MRQVSVEITMPYEMREEAEKLHINISAVAREALGAEIDRLNGSTFERKASELIRLEKQKQAEVKLETELAALQIEISKREALDKALWRKVWTKAPQTTPVYWRDASRMKKAILLFDKASEKGAE